MRSSRFVSAAQATAVAVTLSAALIASALPLAAQQADSTKKVVKLAPVGVTATRTESSVLRTAVPMLVIDSTTLRADYPNGIGDVFRNLPGVDVTGVGPNQVRLMIRGQRGQRILLAEDGMRLNNARRQQDFGELSAITDVNSLERVEVVRGPASVLYGTDAIGGVVNQLTLGTPGRGRDGVSGTSFYRYNEADGQDAGHLRVAGREGAFGFALSTSHRVARAYSAPAGTFGALTLANDTEVRDSGVQDRSHAAQFSVDLGARQTIGLKLSRYDAREAGYGYVDPLALGDSSGTVIRLLYPEQTVDRAVLSYNATALGTRFADKLAVTVSNGRNDRVFSQALDIPFTPTAGMTIRDRNVTRMLSDGLRVEATKVTSAGHVFTYGADLYRDRSTNSDSSVTRMYGFGPPSTTTSTTPNLPNAWFSTGGVFAQGRFNVAERLELGAGVRGQTIHSETQETTGLPADRAGVTASTSAFVGQLSGIYRVQEGFNVVASVGRAFRAPNLIERYFEGTTTDGNGYQLATPALAPETSLNVDLGVKFRRARFYGEITVFVNTIDDAIRIIEADTTVNGFDGYRNANIDRLRDTGIEALGELQLGRGFSVLGYVSTLDSKNVDTETSVGDSYGSKVGGELGWLSSNGRYGIRYDVRHQGERKDVVLSGSPIGDRLPAFTTHAVRSSVRLPSVVGVQPTLDVAVTNLTNELFSEASNSGFFRPEARRSVMAAMRFDF
jgi:hemoglobin/transferrin/lactoferrin receptor protein